MSLFFIGIGLGNCKDISINGLEAIKSCDKVFLEGYTSIFGSSTEELFKLYEKEVIILGREDVEQKSEQILDPAKEKNVAFLVIGDVFGATTHIDLWLRAKEKNIECKYIPNASIINAIGITGLELYKFGKTTSMVFFEENWMPTTAYETIEMNLKNGLHTLILLDIKVAEPNKEDIKKGKRNVQPPRFMTINEGLNQLLDIEEKLGKNIINKNTKVIGCARIGSNNIVKYGKISDLINFDFGSPLHCIIIPGKLHFMEEEMLNTYK
jgi:diphthine methyl ester synthase